MPLVTTRHEHAEWRQQGLRVGIGYNLSPRQMGTGHLAERLLGKLSMTCGLAGMVRAMIQLAQSLGMTPLAEGIETFGEMEFLGANGCRLAQGFHFAHPVPAEEIPALLQREGGLLGTE